MGTTDKTELIMAAADAKQARDMNLLDLRGLTIMTDYFFICSGTSAVHIRTIVDSIVTTMKHNGFGGIRVEGYDAASWVLMDYGDVVVHVMSPAQREYYRLEEYWSGARTAPVEQSALPAAV